eukprot:m.131505 g.131505  ORF g.131505 m.131505 type:complete len:56 (+) comp9477_c1_seq18:2449-2616(+)
MVRLQKMKKVGSALSNYGTKSSGKGSSQSSTVTVSVKVDSIGFPSIMLLCVALFP